MPKDLFSSTDEAVLKSHLMVMAKGSLPSNWVGLRHEDKLTSGHPDISFTGLKLTSWIEVKYATPYFKSRLIQRETVKRLAIAGIAWYIVFYDFGGVRRTYIIQADEFELGHVTDQKYTVSPQWTSFVEGFDFRFCLIHLLELHRDHVRP